MFVPFEIPLITITTKFEALTFYHLFGKQFWILNGVEVEEIRVVATRGTMQGSEWGSFGLILITISTSLALSQASNHAFGCCIMACSLIS
jgi:hypothetical protein